MKKYLFFLLVVIAGGLSTVQAPVNAQLRLHFTNDPILATLISYSTSFILMVILALVLRVQGPTWKFRETRWWHWLGGIVGGSYVCIMTIAVARIGNAAATSILVLGQLVFGLLLDQFGLLGMQVRKVQGTRLAGIACVLGGALLVFNF